MAQPVRVPTGQQYGKAKEMADAQRAIPLPNAPAAPSPSAAGAPRSADAASMWQAPVTPLNAPSQRPGEHVMDGVAAGPGRDPAQAGIPGHEQGSARDEVLATLRGLYQKFPISSLGAAIRDFAQQPPWTVKDLTVNFRDPTDMGNGITVVGTRPVPGWGTDGGMQFDPEAPLDTSQVEDRRDPAYGAAAGAASAAVAGASVPPAMAPDQPMPPAESVDRADLIRKRQGAQ